MFKERGELLLLKFAERLQEFGALEGMPKMEGKRMLVMFAPKSQPKKKSSELGKLVSAERAEKSEAKQPEQ